MKPSHRLRGTRHLVKPRLAVVVLLSVVVLSYLSISYQASARSATQTMTTSSATSAKSTTSTSTSTTSTNSTTTVLSADLYRIDTVNLYRLTNSTSVQFTNSTGTVPYYVVSQGSSAVGLVFLTTDVAPQYTYGFRGLIGLLVYLNLNGTIKSVILWTSNEPMTYDITPQYLSTYVGRNVFERLVVGSDVVGITGATYSSVGIADGIRAGGRMVVNDHKQAQVQVQIQTQTQTRSTVSTYTTNAITENETQAAPSSSAVASSWQFTGASLIVVFFGATVLAYETNSENLRYAILGSAVILLGFYKVLMVSVTDVTNLVTGVFPPFLTHYYWYILYLGVLLTSLVWGRLYCGSICPFGAFTHLLYKVSPFRFVMPKRLHARLVYLKYVVLALVVVGVSWSALWVARIEPFATFFLLRGDSWMWGVLGAALLFSVPFDRFYCSYVCPAGAGLAMVARLRIEEINRWPECITCKICERDCPTGAISGGEISALECMNCRACEVNYSNPMVCPHYASQRVGNAFKA